MNQIRAISRLIACSFAWCICIQVVQADDVNVAGKIVTVAVSRPPLGGRAVGLYADKNRGQKLDGDTTSDQAIYSLATRGVSGNVVALYVLYDGTDFDAQPVEVHPEPPQNGLRRAKADNLVLLDAKTLADSKSALLKQKGIPPLSAAFFSDLEVRKWAGVLTSGEVDERVAGFVARVGGTSENYEEQSQRIAMIWHSDSQKAIHDAFETLHIKAKPDAALEALKSPRVVQLLNDHFTSGHPEDSWQKKYNARAALGPSVIEGFAKTMGIR